MWTWNAPKKYFVYNKSVKYLFMSAKLQNVFLRYFGLRNADYGHNDREIYFTVLVHLELRKPTFIKEIILREIGHAVLIEHRNNLEKFVF